MLTCQPLPTAEPEFFELLNLYFPCVFDIKYLMKFCDNLHGGLNKLAELLDVQVRCKRRLCERLRQQLRGIMSTQQQKGQCRGHVPGRTAAVRLQGAEFKAGL